MINKLKYITKINVLTRKAVRYKYQECEHLIVSLYHLYSFLLHFKSW